MFDLSEDIIAATAAAVTRATGVTVWPDLPPVKEWLSAIQELSDRFNRLKVSKSLYQGGRLEEAYCLYFFPVNVVRLLHLFGSLKGERTADLDSLTSRSGLTVWDLGCGPGTASFAWSLFAPTSRDKAEFVLVDSNPKMLALAERVLSPRSVRTVAASVGQADLTSLPDPDLILAANLLNEMPEDTIPSRLEALVGRLKEGGLLVLVEPALRLTSRRLLAARDALVAACGDNTSLIYPCTHTQPCPARHDPANWCYLSCTWNRPEWIAAFDRHLGLNKRELDFTPVVFQKKPPAESPTGAYRIVSDLSSRKWGWECFLCSREGLVQTVLRNRAAKKLGRGGILSESDLTALGQK